MNDSTLLYRQIHPSQVQDGRVTSQAFRPMPEKDGTKLSMYNGDLVTAEESHRHFVDEIGGQSRGVLAVSVEECHQEALKEEEDCTRENPYHVLVDFAGLGKNQIRRASEKLRDKALARGWMFKA